VIISRPYETGSQTWAEQHGVSYAGTSRLVIEMSRVRLLGLLSPYRKISVTVFKNRPRLIYSECFSLNYLPFRWYLTHAVERVSLNKETRRRTFHTKSCEVCKARMQYLECYLVCHIDMTSKIKWEI